MPWGLKRFQQSGQTHFVTFCCYHGRPLFTTAAAKQTFELALERVRSSFRLRVYGYVVIPEHVHLLISEPERPTLAHALKKQGVSRRLMALEEDFRTVVIAPGGGYYFASRRAGTFNENPLGTNSSRRAARGSRSHPGNRSAGDAPR